MGGKTATGRYGRKNSNGLIWLISIAPGFVADKEPFVATSVTAGHSIQCKIRHSALSWSPFLMSWVAEGNESESEVGF